jgi:hypothetical protein
MRKELASYASQNSDRTKFRTSFGAYRKASMNVPIPELGYRIRTLLDLVAAFRV